MDREQEVILKQWFIFYNTWADVGFLEGGGGARRVNANCWWQAPKA